MPTNPPTERTPQPELLRFLSSFDPALADLALEVRALVLSEAPGSAELVYDAYNAVSIAFSFTGRLKEAFCHVAVYPRHVNLGFNRGAELSDAGGHLRGGGRWIRHLRIEDAAALRAPHVRELLRGAVARAERPDRLPEGPASRVQAVSPRKRRPR